MYLTDLTFIDDGNPDMVDNKINWNKRELTYRVLSEIELYQQVPYNFPPVEPIRTFLTELPGINEKARCRRILFIRLHTRNQLTLCRSCLNCRYCESRVRRPSEGSTYSPGWPPTHADGGPQHAQQTHKNSVQHIK